MHPQATEPAGGGICVAHGYGIKIAVHRGHLIVHDGIGRQRRSRRYHRATSKLRRLVLIGQTGYLTLDALRWLTDTAAALIQLDHGGRLTMTSSAPGPGHAALRRSQAMAASTDLGVEVARELLRAKVAGQSSLLCALSATPRAIRAVRSALGVIETADSLPRLLSAEAEAARVYWQAWAAVPVRFTGKDQQIVPEHWCSFAGRHSPVTASPQRASNPANAILNFLYALLGAETTIACQAVGLDPLLGIFHTDQRNRASLAFDVMEAARPAVDSYLLDFLNTEQFSRHDFAEARDGSCRLSTTLAQRLSETVLLWRGEIAPFGDRVAAMLAAAAQTTVAAPLTQAYRRAAQATPEARTPARRPGLPPLFNSCRDCGAGLSDRRRRYCDACRAERFQAHVDDIRAHANPVITGSGVESVRDHMKASTRAQKNAQHQKALREWTGPPTDPNVFRTEIWPGLCNLDDAVLMAATGLSAYYCSQIRLGRKTPHPRHWAALRQCAPTLRADRVYEMSAGEVVSVGARSISSARRASCET